jgi:hypothetical protein
MVVLYTDDIQVYGKLRGSKKLIKRILYEQQQKQRIAIVGVDLYFPKRYLSWLQKQVEGLKKEAIFT